MYRLHCFSQSGPCFKVAFLLRALAQPYETVFVDYNIVDQHLALSPFIVGSTPTIADFSMCGYLFYPAEESGYDVQSRFPNLAAWLGRVKSIPGWASPYDILLGERIAPKWS